MLNFEPTREGFQNSFSVERINDNTDFLAFYSLHIQNSKYVHNTTVRQMNIIWGFDPKRARGAMGWNSTYWLRLDCSRKWNDVRIDQRDDRLDMVVSKDSEELLIV